MIFGLIFKSMSVHHSRPFDHVLLLFVRERGSADSVGRSLLATEADVAGKFVHPDYSRHLAVVTDAARSIGAGLQAADEHCYGDSSGLARHLNSDLILAESRGAVRGYTVGILIPDPSYKSLNGPESAKFCLHSTNSIERPAQEAAQVAPDRFVFQLQDAAHVNHLVVFAATPFPDSNYGAAVYFSPPNRPDQWSFLGILSNEKPSAIFRLREAVATESGPAGFQAAANVATLGLQIQDLPTLQASTSNSVVLASAQARPPPNPTTLAQLTAKNLFNYLSSFAQRQQDPTTGRVLGNYVDITLIENWLRSFEAKTKNGGTSWLETQSD